MTADASRKRILIVDEDEAIVAGLAAALDHAGLEPIVAGDRWGALDLFQRWHPAAVLVNVDLGKDDGRAICTAIRSRSDGSIVPILFLGTGDAKHSIRTPSEAL